MCLHFVALETAQEMRLAALAPELQPVRNVANEPRARSILERGSCTLLICCPKAHFFAKPVPRRFGYSVARAVRTRAVGEAFFFFAQFCDSVTQACVAERPEILQQAIISKCIDPRGKYKFRLWTLGQKPTAGWLLPRFNLALFSFFFFFFFFFRGPLVGVVLTFGLCASSLL